MINWNGYFVDNNGVIYNKDGSIKSLKVNTKGYYFTNFYYGGKSHTHSAHRVVAEAIHGECPDGYEVDHVDNNRQNNHPDNLRYLTKSQNNQKAYDSGNRKFLFGQSNPNSISRKVQRLSLRGVGQTS